MSVGAKVGFVELLAELSAVMEVDVKLVSELVSTMSEGTLISLRDHPIGKSL